MVSITADKMWLAEKAITRAITGLWFLVDVLRFRHGGTDGGFSRSWYILLSFNFELILNALFILDSKKELPGAIVDDIKKIKPSHDMKRLSESISEITLRKFGIIKVKKRSNKFIEYVIETTGGKEVTIQDLKDVRYDYVKDHLRPMDPEEIARIKNEVEILRQIAKSIQEYISMNKAGFPKAPR